MSIIQAIILAIVEGLTEFLPISSTGHMILVSSMMGIEANHFVKMFTVAIQFGAILSVIVLYWKRFFQTIQFYTTLIIAFIPAAVFGMLLNDWIDELLESALVVGVSLLLGGIVLLFIDKWFGKITTNDEITYPKAIKIGLFQVIAMIPGVSRSAATIIGGLQQKLSRKAAAEFSFFLAVPTMFAATAYKLYKYINEGNVFGTDELIAFGIGNAVAFVVAMIAIKAFISYLTKHGFKIFGWYRIVVGLAIILWILTGHNLHII